jgi:hypothetical protein
MKMMSEYQLVQDKIDELTSGKKYREQTACERRLRQMQKRKEKNAARADAMLAQRERKE